MFDFTYGSTHAALVMLIIRTEHKILLNLIKKLNEDLTQKIINWNNIDQKIFEKANSTFWSRYNKIPNLELLKKEFQIETGNIDH